MTCELNLLRAILVDVSAVCRGSAPASTLLQAWITTGACSWEGNGFSLKGVISTRLMEWDAIWEGGGTFNGGDACWQEWGLVEEASRCCGREWLVCHLSGRTRFGLGTTSVCGSASFEGSCWWRPRVPFSPPSCSLSEWACGLAVLLYCCIIWSWWLSLASSVKKCHLCMQQW